MGVRRTGEFFRVDEPRLLRWVHVTEVESFASTAVRAGLVLTPDEIDEAEVTFWGLCPACQALRASD